MKLLIISDGHGAVEKLHALKSVAQSVDMVLFGGDFAEFNRLETGRPFLQELLKLHDTVFAVIGNCDPPDFRTEIEESGISIESSLSHFDGFLLAGSGGGSKFTGATPNERSDEDLVSDLHAAEALSEKADIINNLIIVTHNPPHKTALDKVAPLVHVGSPLIRAFIERYQPLLAVSGHIHESFAIDTIGKTLLVNPGSLAEGRYALAEITGTAAEGFSVSAELKQL